MPNSRVLIDVEGLRQEVKNQKIAEFTGSFRKSKIRVKSASPQHRETINSPLYAISNSTTLGEIVSAAVKEDLNASEFNSTFRTFLQMPSAAVNQMKLKNSLVEHQNQSYIRSYTTNPFAPPSIGANAKHVLRPSTGPGIRRNLPRPKSAPAEKSINETIVVFTPSNFNSGSEDESCTRSGYLKDPGNSKVRSLLRGSASRTRLKSAKGLRTQPTEIKVETNVRVSLTISEETPTINVINGESSISSKTQTLKDTEKKDIKGKEDQPAIAPQKMKWSPLKTNVHTGTRFEQFRNQEKANKIMSDLTDTDFPLEEVLEGLEELIEISSKDIRFASTTLYDLGVVQIIVDLMKRTSENWEIQYKCAELLQILAKVNEITFLTIYKQNGINHLLKALETVGKAATDFRMAAKNSSPWSKPSGSKNVKKKTDGLLPSTESVTLLSSTDSVLGIKIPDIILVEEDEGGSIKDNNDYLNIVTGLLKHYYSHEFTSKLDRLDRSHKTEIIKHLLSLIKKINLIFSVTTYGSLDVDLIEALSEISKISQGLIQAESIKVYLVDSIKGDLFIPKAKSLGATDEIRFPLGLGVAGYCATYDETVNILQDAEDNELYDPDVDFGVSGSPTDSILCVPIKHPNGGKVLGVLQAINKVGTENGCFNEEDESLLRVLGRNSGMVVNNAYIYQSMLKTQKKVEVLLETTKSLGSTLNLDKLIKMIMESAKELLNADRCTLFLADKQKLELKAHIQGRDTIQEISIPINKGIAGYAFTNSEIVNIPDAYSDWRFNAQIDKQTGYLTKNILCMPIKNISGEAIGITQMINKYEGPFDSDDESILSSFSAQAAVAIEKSYLFKKTEDIRVYLESILSSITSCVITLTEDLILMTMNRDWVINALDVTFDFTRTTSMDSWLATSNPTLLEDLQRCLKTNQPIYSAEYSLKSTKNKQTTKFVNYQIMPLIGKENKGLVVVLEDISSEKRAIMTLGRYMSPALAKQVMEEDGSQLGGKRKKVAILFSDIRSFTTLTESMEPQLVVELLNHHFSDAVNAILAEQGILDKYIGDAVMAVFGVPFVSPDDSIHACNTALRMRASLKIANAARQAAGKKQINVGIGINTGMVLSGNIGSEKRMEFSCIGDAVNLSSRIEGLTKLYNTSILITEYVKIETKDMFWTREIDTVVVTGRTIPVVLYELIGRKPLLESPTGVPVDTTPNEDPMTKLPQYLDQGHAYYTKGLELYKAGMFMEAAENFSLTIEICDDGPAKTMYDRCQIYIFNPPKEGYGVFHCDSK